MALDAIQAAVSIRWDPSLGTEFLSQRDGRKEAAGTAVGLCLRLGEKMRTEV